MLDGLSERDMARQPHVELSPMLWHVGHVFFVESYWLAERVFGDTRATDPWHALYSPEDCAKAARSAAVPDAEELLAWTHSVSVDNDVYWQRAVEMDHPLLTGGYLHAFVSQHYAQHLETMRLALAQLALADKPAPATAWDCAAPSRDAVIVPAGEVTLGHAAIEAYDNERPPVTTTVEEFAIANAPVSNAEWAGFIANRGYDRSELWDADGWAWRQKIGVDHPQHWRHLADGRWGIAGLRGEAAAPDEPVHGIGWYEARAYARYAEARLPLECEWEAACRAERLANTGLVWEWTDDAFAPYPGFRAFPYDGYSRPWFDGAHFVARGASVHTQADIRRPSFRNFYPPTHRHVCAGLRLAW
jgi:iron(II)-dependent oxidoreductase